MNLNSSSRDVFIPYCIQVMRVHMDASRPWPLVLVSESKDGLGNAALRDLMRKVKNLNSAAVDFVAINESIVSTCCILANHKWSMLVLGIYYYLFSPLHTVNGRHIAMLGSDKNVIVLSSSSYHNFNYIPRARILSPRRSSNW